jgi:hypothetical protein
MFESHTSDSGSHTGRWVLFLMAAGGAAYYAWSKVAGGDGSMLGQQASDTVTGVRSGTSGAAA